MYSIGEDQARLQEPISSTSVLIFHDAVELFLQLASEHLNVVTNKKTEFMSYWDLLPSKLDGHELFQRVSMERMNKARVALKHHGTYPSLLDIQSFLQSVTDFFVQNTPLIFGLQYSDISLIDFIEPEKARDLLKEVNQYLETNDKYAAMKNITIAFEIIMDHYEENAIEKYGSSPFDFGSGFTRPRFATYSHIYNGQGQPDQLVIESLESISSAVKVLALNLDYRKFAKFRMIRIPINRAGDSYFPIPQNDLEMIYKKSIEEIFDKADIVFCYNFVIDSGLVINSFYRYL